MSLEKILRDYENTDELLCSDNLVNDIIRGIELSDDGDTQQDNIQDLEFGLEAIDPLDIIEREELINSKSIQQSL